MFLRGKCFFSLAHLIHYTDMKLYILQYKRKMGREKHSFCTKRFSRREGIGSLLFFFFLFLGRVGTRARGWQEETKTVYKEPECKGMHISTNFVDFQSLSTSCSLKQWNVKWLTELDRNSTYIPILGVIKNEVSP